jgi:hypothetical protein
MNKLMILSNRLSETHILNLKTYPKIFFDGVVTAEVKYDFTPPEHGKKADFPAGLVGYKILVKEMPEDVEKRAAFLERAVKNLFWNDTYVTVSVTESVVP